MINVRKLKKCEIEILQILIQSSGTANYALLDGLKHLSVNEMDDGGMGSIYFLSKSKGVRGLGETVAEAEFKDIDGVTVSLCLNLDNRGELLELDMWKTDFSELKLWPSSRQLLIKK